MPNAIQIVRYHVDLPHRIIVVEFRVWDPITATYHPEHGHHRHSVELTPIVADALARDVDPLLRTDLSTVTGVHTQAVTSELHQLREAIAEKRQAKRDVVETRAKHAHAVAQHEKQIAALVTRRTELEGQIATRKAAGSVEPEKNLGTMVADTPAIE